MWLFKKVKNGESLPSNCAELMRYFLKYSYMHDLSFEFVSRQMSNTMKELEEMEMTEEKIQFAQQMLATSEENRQKAMSELDRENLLLVHKMNNL